MTKDNKKHTAVASCEPYLLILGCFATCLVIMTAFFDLISRCSWVVLICGLICGLPIGFSSAAPSWVVLSYGLVWSMPVECCTAAPSGPVMVLVGLELRSMLI